MGDQATDADEASAETAAQAALHRIGLALSGGGIRAAVFHLCVLRRAPAGERVDRFDRVRGSLVTAAVISQSGMKWPTSEDYPGSVYPELRRRIVIRPEGRLTVGDALRVSRLITANARF
ncbi:hypothetical protein [Bradyrhizobium erythrophlei]|jgi:hypothetical protein|uniref:Uncharacterized protein n=1 Tax=Bradyrhizobium erythrophlei TaxID=1437360 RepID=A0A1M5R4I4_9BRAD|nr:hypothetical protein [Bradyrhizobium erythrophlei]SHH21304.1 hypothetical protein SAMN05443248_4082 [Bradyrhizobium erythrophlei]